ncbi:hypothetical protein AB205_0096220 [Aquarana catesbeiana]|uniref:Uncharacterized protein n=1 Tax=Aquarana catesbeiana TaxID=8400 RepID=A0A2G9S987_AQUCT|nr:hypothetical protein AB205_0096220 [Aquarana catesbeiana]
MTCNNNKSGIACSFFQSMGYVIFSGYLLNNTGRMDALSVVYRGGQHLLVPLLLRQP